MCCTPVWVADNVRKLMYIYIVGYVACYDISLSIVSRCESMVVVVDVER